METITKQDVIDASPCYTDGRVEFLFRGRQSGTLQDILDHTGVSTVDKTWILCRLMTEEQQTEIRNRMKERHPEVTTNRPDLFDQFLEVERHVRQTTDDVIAVSREIIWLYRQIEDVIRKT